MSEIDLAAFLKIEIGDLENSLETYFEDGGQPGTYTGTVRGKIAALKMVLDLIK